MLLPLSSVCPLQISAVYAELHHPRWPVLVNQ